MSRESILNANSSKENSEREDKIRPRSFSDFPGQEEVKERLKIFVEASKQRSEPLGHLILSGPPGLGKTTLANIIACEKDANIKASSGPILEKPGDLAGLLTSLKEGDILFIDEIHRLPIAIEEYLYSAMEDFFIDIMIDQGVGARSVRLNLARFTLIGATTRMGLISSPLRSRCQHIHRLDYYKDRELQKILQRTCKIIFCDATKEACLEVASRSRGTPRIANNLLYWVRDYAQVKKKEKVDEDIAKTALDKLNISPDGLDEMDKKILETIAFNFNGGPVGIKNISVAVSEEISTIEDVYEPFLIQKGYIVRTSQGRILSQKGKKLVHYNSDEEGMLEF